MAAEVELFKNEKAKSAIWNPFKFKKENQKLVDNIAIYVIIVTRHLSIQVGPQTLPAKCVGITGMLISTLILINIFFKKGPAFTCAPISQGQVKLSTMVKGGIPKSES